MKRQIKFEYGFESQNGIVKKVYELSQIPNIASICDVWNELPICYVRQFTGLKDINGKDIYDGDIVNISTCFGYIKNMQGVNAIYIVSFKTCEYSLFRPDIKLTWGRLSRLEEMNYNCEIIGNIYENPELLKTTENE